MNCPLSCPYIKLLIELSIVVLKIELFLELSL